MYFLSVMQIYVEPHPRQGLLEATCKLLYPACDCYVAAHRKTMLPMGTLADKALRKKRHDAHVALDSLWKNGIMSRKEAYRLLQLSMGLPAEDAHIAKFSAARCDEVIALSRRFRAAAARAA